jgi:PAS domain S-box-containing protein
MNQTVESSGPTLAGSRELFEAVLRNLGDGIVVTAAGGERLFANDEAARLTGYASAEELMAAPADFMRERFQIFHPDGKPMDPGELPGRRAFAGEDPEPMLVRFRHRDDGTDRISEVRAVPIRDATGATSAVIHFFREVTTEHSLARRQQVAAEVGRALGASLDYERTLQEIAAAAVPHIADWCHVDVLDAGGHLTRVATAHIDPAQVLVLEELARRWPRHLGYVGTERVVASGEPEISGEVTDERLAAAAADDEHLLALRELGISSTMCVPLGAGERVLGAVTFVSAESQRRYDGNDLLLAEDIAARASAALDNATLYQEAQRTSALLDSLYAGAPIGLGFWDRELRYVRVNEALARINERSAEDHIGRTFQEVVPQLAHIVEPMARRVLEQREPVVAVEVAAGTPNDPEAPRHWLASYYPVLAPSGEAIGVGAVVEEVTDRRRAEQRSALQFAAAQTLAEADTVSDAVPRILETICESLGWDVSCYWPIDSDDARLTWVRPGVQVDGFVAMTERSALLPTMIPGRVSQSRRAEWLVQLPAEGPRASVGEAEGLVSGVAFPIVVGPTLVGVIEAFSLVRRPYDAQLLETLSALGGQLGQFIRRKRAEEDAAQLLDRERQARAEAESAAATLRKLARVAEAVLEHVSLEDLLVALLGRIVEVLEADTAAILLVDDAGALRVRATVGFGDVLDQAVPIPLGEGLAGRVAASRSSLLVPDLAEVQLRSPLLRGRGINSLVAVPLVVEDIVIGVVHAGSEAFAQFSDDDAGLLELIADRIALAIQQVALSEAEREAQGRLQFFGEASTLLASSLDVDATLARVARLVVPHFADWCAVDIVADDGTLDRVAVEHFDPDRAEIGRRLSAAVHPRIDDEFGIGRAVRTGQPIIAERVDEETLRTSFAARPEYLEAVLQLGMSSTMIVPLVARGRTLGALTFVWAESGKTYGQSDFQFAQELGARAAVALDNARLYREAERGRERLGFLAEASALLGASLEVDETLVRLGSLIAGRVADWCTIHLAEENGARLVTVAHADSELAARARTMIAALTPVAEPTEGVLHVIQTGEPELFAEVPDELLDGPARELGVHSTLTVALVARGRTLGAMSWAWAETPSSYDEADLSFAVDLARRAAIAIDNAQLYREAEERAQAARVLASVGDGVFLIDRHGVIRTWNRAAAMATGLRVVDVVDREAAEVIPGWTTVVDQIPVAAEGTSSTRAESLPLDLGDRELWLSLHGVAVPDGVVYAFRDLTEERALETMRTEFVSTVSHELRTPLAAIYGAAMTLRRSDVALDDDQRAKMLDVVSGEADRLARTVNDILWASRLDAGSLHVSIQRCDALTLISGVVDAQNAHLDTAHELVLTAEDDLPEIAGDPDKVGRVLINLVDNAIKYSPDGGRVDVHVRRIGGRVRFSVIDRGLGIPLAEQRRIFEKFYRLDPNMTRGVGGTGLGLYICRELVRRMDGRIWVESGGLGRGSTFSIEFPVAGDFAAHLR